jgi:hypothetical protein
MPWKEMLDELIEEIKKQREKTIEDEAAIIAFREVLRQEYGARPEDIARETYRHVDCLLKERRLRTISKALEDKIKDPSH